jgi:hypothetical protein
MVGARLQQHPCSKAQQVIEILNQLVTIIRTLLIHSYPNCSSIILDPANDERNFPWLDEPITFGRIPMDWVQYWGEWFEGALHFAPAESFSGSNCGRVKFLLIRIQTTCAFFVSVDSSMCIVTPCASDHAALADVPAQKRLAAQRDDDAANQKTNARLASMLMLLCSKERTHIQQRQRDVKKRCP